MPRASMSDLIALVRRMIGDPPGAEQMYSDDDIEFALDTNGTDVRYEPLTGLATYTSNGAQYLTWLSRHQNWESDAELTDSAYNTLTSSSSEPLRGRWTFASSQSSVFAAGRVYDIYAAAADLLEQWAASVSTEYDVSADGTSMSRSQKAAMLMAAAQRYRAMQNVSFAKQVRNDIA